MDGEAKAALEPILHLSVPLGPVVRSPELLEPVLKLLEPSVFLKPMLVFVELVVLLSVDGGQRRLLQKGKSSKKYICRL